MAQIVIGTVPATGHITPILPLARALVALGHDVRWSCGQKHADKIAATGARFVPYQHTVDIDEAQLDEHFPARKGLTGLAAIKHDIKHVFLDASLTMLRDLEDLHAECPIDLLIADVAYVGAQFMHERTRVPLVVINVVPLFITSRDVPPLGLALPPSSSKLGQLRNRALHWTMQNVLLRDVRTYYHSLRRQAGLAPVGWFIDTHERASIILHPSIPSLEYPRSDLPDNVHLIGMLPIEQPRNRELPPWFDELTDRRVVHVTQGTIANLTPHLIAPALRGLAHEDALIVVTTGGRSAQELGLGQLPKNARVAPFIPYSALLPKCDVMLTNGGFGGVQIALQHGVPLIVAGDTEDKPEVAARVAFSGAGIDLRTGKPSPRAIRRAVRRALEQPALRKRASELRAEYERYDALALAVDHIERLLGRTRSVTSGVANTLDR